MRNVDVAVAVKASLGECPRWDSESGCLYWIDINKFRLNRYNPVENTNDYLQFKEEIGCFSLRQHGGFVLAMRSGFFLLDDWDTHLIAICDPEADLPHNRFNDGRCDAMGRLIAGSYYPPKDHDGANLWSLGLDLQPTKLADDLLTSNGAAFSPDNAIFYYADTPKHVIYRCEYDLANGAISNRRVFHQFPHGQGRPDGASVDVEGCYWTALYEGQRIVRISPQGDILEEINIPARCPTMVAFGGHDLKTLYVTSVGDRSAEELEAFPLSGSVFEIQVDVAGLPEYRFFK